MIRFLTLSLLIVGLTVQAPPYANAQELQGVASVIDGDTLEIHGERIRLHGIDAPESSQLCHQSDGTKWRCGQAAALALQERIGRNPISCMGMDTDHYGRMIAVCEQGSVDLNGWLVSEGWAVAYRRYSKDYIGSEERARSSSRNIWASSFVMPWDWRRGDRVQATRVAENATDGGCDIKGNISRSGERIYHVPGDRFYERTRVNTSAGERWFCSENDAVSAGWRRSKQ